MTSSDYQMPVYGVDHKDQEINYVNRRPVYLTSYGAVFDDPSGTNRDFILIPWHRINRVRIFTGNSDIRDCNIGEIL